ncbi:MAG: sugar-binding protein [Capsulimonadaceae bacterium]|nr:sugar-binding protein [Capsulimonadaceae bacterium]
MFLRHLLSTATAATLLFAAIPLSAAPARVGALLTTWDSLYVYVAVDVRDKNVISLNDTLTSHPQQDDDVEVFFETDGPHGATLRTSKTVQMAVSAANGAYFSVGNGTAIPTPKSVFDYKFAAYVDGPLNTVDGKGNGFTVELAIPWAEFGLDGPPPAGTAWGFNVISRDRDSLTAPAQTLYSLSPLVESGDDVQNPSKWSQITFTDTATALKSTATSVISPHVSASLPPVIDGTISAGEWPTATGLSFGDRAIAAPAPTPAQEPNTGDASSAPAPSASPAVPAAPSPTPSAATPAPVPAAPAPNPDYNIYLPGGGVVHVNGGASASAPVAAPPAPSPAAPAARTGKAGKGKPAETPVDTRPSPVGLMGDERTNPLSPANDKRNPLLFLPNANNPAADQQVAGAPDVDTTLRPPLPAQSRVSPRVMALYELDEQPGAALDGFFDQPEASLGPWYGARSGRFLAEELRNARLSGVEVLLPVFSGAPTQLTALRGLVQALKTIDDNGGDYPLLGLWLTGDDNPFEAVSTFFSMVPPKYRAQVFLGDQDGNKRAYVVVADHAVDRDSLNQQFQRDFGVRNLLAISTLTEGSPIVTATVSPGGRSVAGLAGRRQTQTYEASWDAALKRSPDWVVVDSWNDLRRGTEVALTRQHADQYANLTRVFASKWGGDQAWSARVLSSDAPNEILTKALYEVHVRVENTGTLPWGRSQGYALSYRWYTMDGKLIDDSAPRIPLQNDILPGDSVPVTFGLAALNGFGSSIDPGEYILAIDVVQGNRRWFSYAANIPLKVHMTIAGDAAAAANLASVLSTTTPSFVKPGSVYNVQVRVRNDGAGTWTAGKTSLLLALKEDAVPGGAAPGVWKSEAPLTVDAPPGDVAVFDASLAVPPSNGIGFVASWKLNETGYKGGYNERLGLTASDSGPEFGITDMARQFSAGQKVRVRLSLRNPSHSVVHRGEYRVSYRIYYLDGLLAGPSTTPPAQLRTDIAAGQEDVVFADFQAPAYPGRYTVVWGLVGADGDFLADSQTFVAQGDTLPLQIWVTADKNARTVPVDLTAQFNERGVAFEGEATKGFDGAGGAIPGEMLPPDGTQELDGDPLLIGKAGPALYPSGYYSSATGDQWESNHRISFLFPGKNGANVVAAHGQKIPVPRGTYRTAHILAASSSGTPITASIGMSYGSQTTSSTIELSTWSSAPSTASVGFRTSYRLLNGEVVDGTPCILVDYAVSVDPSNKLSAVILPDDPRVKVLAITLEK